MVRTIGILGIKYFDRSVRMITSDSHVLRKEACPECRKIGNDKSGDNLAVYSDGHTYCYRCGHGTGRKSFTTTARPDPNAIVLPADVTTELPYEARAWLSQYQLARLDLNRNHVMWSERWSRIIFPYFNETELLAWQGRYVGTDKTKAKWFSQGKIHEIIHPIKINQRKAVLVEDIISAIKVSKTMGTIPIFGSSISTKQMLRLKTIVDEVWFWMDPDMRTKSVKMARMSSLLGIQSHVIFSDKDPKEHDHESIANILRENQATA